MQISEQSILTHLGIYRVKIVFADDGSYQKIHTWPKGDMVVETFNKNDVYLGYERKQGEE